MQNPISIDIKFDRPRPNFGMRESINGQVIVTAHVDCVLSSFEILSYTVDVEDGSQQGERRAKPGSKITLRKDQIRSFPFLFTAIEQPFFWSGEADRSEWKVEAKIEVQRDGEMREDFSASKTYAILKTPEQADGRSKAPSEGAKRQGKQLTAGEYFWSMFMSLFAWAAVGFGYVLCMNGYSEKVIPVGVRYFGLAMLVGGFFVAGKILGNLGTIWQRGIAVIATAASLLAFYAFVHLPSFDILRPQWESQSPASILMVLPPPNQLLMAITGFLLMFQAGMLWNGNDPKRMGLFELGMGVPGWVLVSVTAGTLTAWLTGAAMDREALIVHGIVGAVGIAMVVIVMRQPSWNSMRPVMTVFASLPLLILGITQLFVHAGAQGSLPQTVLSASLLIGAAGILVFGNRNLLASLRLGLVEANLSSLQVAPGGFVEATVKFKPTAAVHINGVTARLLCYRSQPNRVHVTSTDTRTWTEYDFTSVAKIDRMVGAGETIEQMVQAVFPAGCRISETGSDSTRWELRLRIDAARAIDWEEVYVIEVVSSHD